jgi:hypothetical protein
MSNADMPQRVLQELSSLRSASSWPSGIEDAARLERIRQATRTAGPAADENSIEALERQADFGLRPQKRGPKTKAAAGEQLYFGVS